MVVHAVVLKVIAPELGNVHQAFLAREVLDERSDGHDARDLAINISNRSGFKNRRK
jgi:hypothetical protein